MKTIAVEIQDNYLKSFISYINNNSDNITISKNISLDNDPYFHERQKELKDIRNNIKNGNSKLISFEDFETSTNKIEKELEFKYGN